MDAALRFVHAALHGRRDVDAYLDAPDYFSTNARECKRLIRNHADLDPAVRLAVNKAISAASATYTRRNRYVHDLLRESLVDPNWEIARLSRQPEGAPEFESVTFDDMVDLVRQLVTAKWRLRGCALYILNRGWESIALGDVAGEWDGSASSTR